MHDIKKLSFPIGECPIVKHPTNEEIQDWIKAIANFPKLLSETVGNLSVEELNWKYRPNGWNIKQVIHHCADSHMNSFIRFKLALTEEQPTIRPYDEAKWAELNEGSQNDISDSMALLKALHNKWVTLLKQLTSAELKRTFIHPATNDVTSLGENIGIYAWHGKHHLAHIKQALAHKGMF